MNEIADDDFRRQELAELRQLEYHESRIPALDALEVFVPDGAGPDAAVDELAGRTGFARWKPVQGGHQVLILYEGGRFDPKRFTLRTAAWDHEHCKRCVCRIGAMESCWVSTEGFTILCEACHSDVVDVMKPERTLSPHALLLLTQLREWVQALPPGVVTAREDNNPDYGGLLFEVRPARPNTLNITVGVGVSEEVDVFWGEDYRWENWNALPGEVIQLCEAIKQGQAVEETWKLGRFVPRAALHDSTFCWAGW